MCTEASGWSLKVDLSDCKSLKLLDSQLYKWSSLLVNNNSLLNAYQALQLAEDLSAITAAADNEDQLNSDMEMTSGAYFSTTRNSLYALDLSVIKNLTAYIMQHEINNAPGFLYIQDKYFLRNLFSTLSRIMNEKYEPKLQQLRSKQRRNTTLSKSGSFELTDLLLLLDEYLGAMVEFNQYLVNEKLNIDLSNIKLHVNAIRGQSYSQTDYSCVKFKLITTTSSEHTNKNLAYIMMDTVGSNLPGNLIVDSGKLTKHHADGFTIVTNILMVKLQQNQQKRALFDLGGNNPTNNKTVYVVVDFVLSSKSFKTASMSSYYCVYFDREKRAWSTRGARLVSYESELNSVKCSYDQLGIYAVATSTSALTGSASAPVQFSLATIILMPFSFALMFIIAVCLLLIKVSIYSR